MTHHVRDRTVGSSRAALAQASTVTPNPACPGFGVTFNRQSTFSITSAMP